jgi:hypothetical protein
MEYEIMGHSLTDFITLTKSNGLSKSSHFKCTFVTPKSMSGVGGNNTATGNVPNTYMLLCKTTQIPGMELLSMNHEEFGEIREVPYQKQFSNINLTYIVDIDLELRRFFEDWMNCIINPVTRLHGYYDDYVTDIIIELEDSSKEGKVRYKVKLYECFPKSIEAINLDYSATGFTELTVSMNYKYYRIIGNEE